MGIHVEGMVLGPAIHLRPPEVDRIFYQSKASLNTSNAALNEVAGKLAGDAILERKQDSLYSVDQFERLQSYLMAEQRPPRLRGVIYVRGPVSLTERRGLHVSEGTLVTEGTVYLDRGASLAITHSAATRTLPGLVILNGGGLIVTKANLRVHGLVYSSRVISARDDAHLDIVGAVLSDDPDISFWNLASTVVIRYDSAVLGTPGLRAPKSGPLVAWVAAWDELP